MTDVATLDALAFLYIAFGHATDDELSADEMRTLAGRLQAWAPDTSLDTVGSALKNAVMTYRSLGTPRDRLARALDQAQALTTTLPTDQLPQILEDLQSIADADGTVSREERSLIDAIAKVLGVK